MAWGCGRRQRAAAARATSCDRASRGSPGVYHVAEGVGVAAVGTAVGVGSYVATAACATAITAATDGFGALEALHCGHIAVLGYAVQASSYYAGYRLATRK